MEDQITLQDIQSQINDLFRKLNQKLESRYHILEGKFVTFEERCVILEENSERSFRRLNATMSRIQESLDQINTYGGGKRLVPVRLPTPILDSITNYSYKNLPD